MSRTAAVPQAISAKPRCFALPRTAMTLVSGHGGREKIVGLTGVGPALIERRLASAAASDRGRKERR